MLANPPAILFVDDEKNILKSLMRLFMDEELDLFTAISAQEGLRILEEEHIDIVISDVRMPEMDGIEFLHVVRQRYPQIIRLFLTGYAEEVAVIKTLSEGYAQQVITKPWDEAQLKDSVNWVLQQIVELEENEAGLKKIVGSLATLPPVLETYTELQECLAASDGPDIDKLAKIIQNDMALSSDILHWSNSALFGQMRKVETINRALVVLGLDMASGLILSKAISQKLYKTNTIQNFNFDHFQKHSIGCGVIARLLVKEEAHSTQEDADKAFTAGMLHDLGKLAELSVMPDKFQTIIDQASREKTLFIKKEKEIMQTSHAELGAYLADWWSFPQYLIEVIRLHHKPILCSDSCIIDQAVYAANILAQQFGIGASGNYDIPEINPTISARFDLTDERRAAIFENIKDIV